MNIDIRYALENPVTGYYDWHDYNHVENWTDLVDGMDTLLNVHRDHVVEVDLTIDEVLYTITCWDDWVERMDKVDNPLPNSLSQRLNELKNDETNIS